MTARSLLAVTISVAVAAPATAHAEEPIPHKAKRLAAEGRALHEAGEYGRAIVAFQEAYVLAPAPALLFNLAQAYRLQGNCEDAAYMYRRFLASEEDREARSVAAGHLDTVERCMHKQGLGIPLESPVAAHGVPAQSPARAGGSVGDDHPPGTGKQRLGVGFMIAGGIALGVAAVDGLHAGDDDDTSAIYLGVGGAVAAVTGVTLYLLGRRDARTAMAVLPAPSGGAVVTAGWRF